MLLDFVRCSFSYFFSHFDVVARESPAWPEFESIENEMRNFVAQQHQRAELKLSSEAASSTKVDDEFSGCEE